MPIAGFATLDNQQLTLNALVGSLDGQSVLRYQAQTTDLQAVEQLGETVAEGLLAQGADKVWRRFMTNLAGLNIINTRPANRAQPLTDALMQKVHWSQTFLW